ncbi:MAG: hypothetical protein ACLFVP_06175 [Candidatus Bathyarchaeia archaeon]
MGFLFYGLNIVIRLGTEYVTPTNLEVVAAFFYILGYFLFFAGIGDLIDRLFIMLVSALILPITIIITYLSLGNMIASLIVGILPYLIITTSLLIINRYYSVRLNLLSLGWMILLMVNLGWIFKMIEVLYVEILAIFGKLVIFFGMRKPNFSLMVDEFKEYLLQGLAEEYLDEDFGRMLMIKTNSRSREPELKWIEETIEENKSKGIRTIFISLYDMISHQDLLKRGIMDENLYYIRMISGGSSQFRIFQDYSMSIKDDLDILGMLLKDVIDYTNERNIRCSIVMYNLSNLIHTHNWRRVYSFIISKISQINNSRVNMFFFYDPDTHEEASEIHKFEMLASQIITL